MGVLAGGYALLHFVVLAPRPIPVRLAAVERGVVERVVTNTRAGSVRARHAATLAAGEPVIVSLDREEVRAGARVAAETAPGGAGAAR